MGGQGDFGDHSGANSATSTPMFLLAWFPRLEAHVIVLRVSVFRAGTQAEQQPVKNSCPFPELELT